MINRRVLWSWMDKLTRQREQHMVQYEKIVQDAAAQTRRLSTSYTLEDIAEMMSIAAQYPALRPLVEEEVNPTIAAINGAEDLFGAAQIYHEEYLAPIDEAMVAINKMLR